MNMMGFTYADHNPDSWEGWHWGGMHMWGFSWRLGNPEQYDLLEDGLKHCRDDRLLVGRPRDQHRHLLGAYESRPSAASWLKELGVKMVFIDPYLQPHRRLDRRQVVLAPLGHRRRAVVLAIAYTWLTEGTYDKEYVATHAHGFEEWAEYVLGKTDGVPKTCEWAETECGVPALRNPRPGPRVGEAQDHARRRRSGRLGRRLPQPARHRMGPRHDRAATMQGMGKPGSTSVAPRRALRWTTTSTSRAMPKAASRATARTPPRASVCLPHVRRLRRTCPSPSNINTAAGQHISAA